MPEMNTGPIRGGLNDRDFYLTSQFLSRHAFSSCSPTAINTKPPYRSLIGMGFMYLAIDSHGCRDANSFERPQGRVSTTANGARREIQRLGSVKSRTTSRPPPFRARLPLRITSSNS